MRNVAEMGLQILYQMLQNISSHEAAQSFYQTYYTDIMQHILSVVTDSSHTPGLTLQATILAYMFSLIEMGKVTVPLGANVVNSNNILYIQEYLAQLLKAAFPHLNE